MSKRVATLSLAYWFSATTLGMLAHPYKTMREVVRKKALRVSVLAPLVWGGLFWMMAIVIILVGRVFGNALQVVYPELLYSSLEFLFWWVMWFLFLWQILVGYLFFRFRRVF